MAAHAYKPWSLSTTVRNPERLQDFLRVLKRFEGQPFNESTQIDYQVALIQERLYRPTKIPANFVGVYEDYDSGLDWETALAIFRAQQYKDPPMRGRQSLNPLKKLGFVRIEGSNKILQLTPSGNKALEGEKEFLEVFFRAMLKLQFPNPLSKGFTHGFNIRPFVAVLSLLRKIYEDFGIAELDREEFCLFVPTLIDAGQVSKYAQKIQEYRNVSGTESKKRFVLDWVREFYEEPSLNTSDEKYNNLFDYGDNALRAFRLTGFLQVQSDPIQRKYAIRIEPTREAQVKQLLENFTAYAQRFESAEAYVDYLGDYNQPILPWEHSHNLREAIHHLIEWVNKNQAIRPYIDSSLLQMPDETHEIEYLRMIESKIRESIRLAVYKTNKESLRYKWDYLEEISYKITEKEFLKGIKPEEFEKLISNVFLILNDEVQVHPNYPTDEYGNPLSHAPGNRADIEVQYPTFDLLIEVTLDKTRFQWIRESQPVMRHLKDYEEKHTDKDAYCLFIAPKVHEDTYSQFWIAVRYEYGGKPRRIIPLTTEQFTQLLKFAIAIGEFRHTLLRDLLNRLIDDLENLKGYQKWQTAITERLESWIREQADAN
ncbi:MAG: AlwI family type II restriction endonuclease [Fimbriimonadales bacterium]